jgi:hypothetical protein
LVALEQQHFVLVLEDTHLVFAWHQQSVVVHQSYNAKPEKVNRVLEIFWGVSSGLDPDNA